jgi:hypothetical protein
MIGARREGYSSLRHAATGPSQADIAKHAPLPFGLAAGALGCARSYLRQAVEILRGFDSRRLHRLVASFAKFSGVAWFRDAV